MESQQAASDGKYIAIGGADVTGENAGAVVVMDVDSGMAILELEVESAVCDVYWTGHSTLFYSLAGEYPCSTSLVRSPVGQLIRHDILTGISEAITIDSIGESFFVSIPQMELDVTTPTADAGPDQAVTLDGSGSSDEIVCYVWTLDDVEIATGVSPTIILGIGEHVPG